MIDNGSWTEADAGRFERHHGERYDDGPDARELAEFAAEMAEEQARAIHGRLDARVAS